MQKDKIIVGYHSLREALLSGLPLNVIYIDKSRKDKRVKEIKKLARERRVKVLEVPEEKLKSMSQVPHQGLVALVSPVEFMSFDEFLDELKPEAGSIVVAIDSITDVRNLGAIVRTCDAVGVKGVLLPERRTASITDAVVKASSGAVFHVPLVKVVNLAKAIESLKGKGFWTVLLSPDAEISLFDFKERLPLVVILGSESKGPRQKVRERADFVLRIPQKGRISSLNVSVAAGVALYQLARLNGILE